MSDTLERMRDTHRVAADALLRIDDLVLELQNLRVDLTSQIQLAAEQVNFTQFDPDKIADFWEQPYAIIPRRNDEYYVIAPTFVNFQIGWLEKTVKGWNYFVVNKFMSWLAQVPKELQDKLKFKQGPPLTVDGDIVTTGKEHQQAALDRYKDHIRQRRGSDALVIKAGHEFKLIAEMIGDGILPFKPRPIEYSDLIPDENLHIGFGLRQYQLEAWTAFLKYGAIGVYWPFSAGKTFIGMWALAHIKGRKLVVVPGTTLLEQWHERIKKFIPDARDIVVMTYASYEKIRNQEWVLVIFDESHRLPANTFSRLATLRTKYRIGLSATPYREDGRTDFIFALTGYPVGIDWQELQRIGVVNKPTVTLYVVDTVGEKIKKVGDLLKENRKTLIYSYWLELGQDIADKYSLPFVNGSTKNRMEVLQNNDVVVVSSVGGEGVSLPNLERVIEVGFLFGSRREEAQLMGRLFHSQKDEPEHVILMTEEELNSYEKRLYSLQEKGFRINTIR